MAKGSSGGSSTTGGQPGAGKTNANTPTKQAATAQLKQKKAAQKNLLGKASAAAGKGDETGAQKQLAEAGALQNDILKLQKKVEPQKAAQKQKAEEQKDKGERRFAELPDYDANQAKVYDAFASTYDGWTNKLNKKHEAALASYTGGGYRPINQALYTPTTKTKVAITNKIRQLDEAFALPGASAPYDVVTYRSLDHREWYDLLEKNNGTLDGQVLSNPNFLSTSLSKSVVQNWRGKFKLKILVPKGSKAIYLSNGLSSVGSHERELLLPRGTKFKVIKTRLGQSLGKKASKTTLVVRAYTPDHPLYDKL